MAGVIQAHLPAWHTPSGQLGHVPFQTGHESASPLPPPQTIMSDRTTAVAAHRTLSSYSCTLMSSAPPSGQSNVSTSFKQGNVIRDVKPCRFLTAEKKIPVLDHTLQVPTLPDLSPFTGATVLVTGHWSLATPQPTPQGHFRPPSLFAAPVSLLGSLLLPLSTSAHPTSSPVFSVPL